jgi:signal transduction histidine kinase/CheY-like chemotaxis protein
MLKSKHAKNDQSSSRVPLARHLWAEVVERYRTDTDFAQSVVRLILALATMLLGYWYMGIGQRSLEERHLLFALFPSWMTLALLLSASCLKWPGHFWYRRILGMLIDYPIVAYWIFLGAERSPPLIALILWTTIGNGLRFGRNYLGIAMGFALVSAIVIIMFSPYWRGNPSLGIMLILCILIVPLYPFALLQRTFKAEKAAQTANAEKSLFLAQASHDLRQPIHAIGLFVAQLRETGLSAEQANMVGKIDRSVHGAGQLFQSLLDVSTLESGGLIADPKPVYLARLFEDLARQNELLAQWSKVKIRIAPTTATVFADPAFLATMLQNLIANALKYAPGSRIVIGCRRKAGRLTIGVYDNGPGIAEIDLPHITERFFRAEASATSSIAGMGLGLSIVERLATLLELTVQIKSTPGRGVAALIEGFEIVSEKSASTEKNDRPYPQQLRNLSVLLIEDDGDTLEATGALLGKWGCRVNAHTMPPAALPECDIIISDFEFGGSDTLAKHWPRLAKAGAPVIVITGSDPVQVKAALRQPNAVILSKPVRPAELRSLLMAKRSAITVRI